MQTARTIPQENRKSKYKPCTLVKGGHSLGKGALGINKGEHNRIGYSKQEDYAGNYLLPRHMELTAAAYHGPGIKAP